MRFNQNDDYDRKKQIEYLNNKPEYQDDKLRLVPEEMKSFDFWNWSKIVEFKKRNCNHNTFPNFILQEDKMKKNIDKIWEWNISEMVKDNKLPEPIVKNMNKYTFVDNPEKVPKKVYMLTLAMGYEI
jgi:hypothetical protein